MDEESNGVGHANERTGAEDLAAAATRYVRLARGQRETQGPLCGETPSDRREREIREDAAALVHVILAGATPSAALAALLGSGEQPPTTREGRATEVVDALETIADGCALVPREPERIGDTQEEIAEADAWVLEEFTSPKDSALHDADFADGDPVRMRALIRRHHACASELAALIGKGSAS